MARGKGRGSPRKPRNAVSPASDVEMQDADLACNERPNLRTRNEHGRRGQVGQTFPSPRAGGARVGKQQGGGATDGPGGRGMKANTTKMVSRRTTNRRRASTLSAASTAAPARDAGPWCDKCASLNRQLHSYLLGILMDGEAAIGDWAYTVGASADHMECEPAPERIIPEGFRRCSRQHHPYAAGTEGEAAKAMVPPPLTAGWPGTAFTSKIYPVQPAGNAPVQATAGASLCSQLGSRSEPARRTLEPTSAPAGGDLQTGHPLVAIPERAGSYAQRTRQPSQAQLPAPQPLQPPWKGGFQRPVAMYPNSWPEPGTAYNWADQQRQVPPNGLSGYGNQQRVAAVHNPSLSLAHNGAMRGVGQGRMFQAEQALPDSDIPE